MKKLLRYAVPFIAVIINILTDFKDISLGWPHKI